MSDDSRWGHARSGWRKAGKYLRKVRLLVANKDDDNWAHKLVEGIRQSDRSSYCSGD